jgi:bacteriocin biosynthesis cyclodehydratase domain-containing protein
MLSKPVLKGYLTVAPSKKGGWLLHGGESELLRARADAQHQQVFDVLLPLLDGRRTVAELVDACSEQSEQIEPQLVEGVLQALLDKGLVEEADTAPLSPEEADHFRGQLLYFGRFSGEGSGAALQSKLKQAQVDVLVTGSLGASVARQLQRLGIGRLRLLGEDRTNLESLAGRLESDREDSPLARAEVVELGRADFAKAEFDPESLLIVALEHWDPALLQEVNARAIATRRPWLLVQAPGIKEGTVGPLFVPPQTACYACLESRLVSHMSFHAEYREFLEHLQETRSRSRPWGALEPAAEVLAGFAALEAVKFLTGFASPAVLGSFVCVDWFALKMRHHHVLRVPRCLSCRPPRVQTFPWNRAPTEPAEEEP